MVEFEIDGKPISAVEGSTIIEAADEAGIYIPRFCYHKKLSIAANCRMCLVEVEKMGKPMPACATPVTPDMKVFTQSPKALQAQRAVMEFLLINHPLDCPICDQGGECELQDLSMGFGRAVSEYDQPKRAVYSHDIGPLIETEMTRCIHCTRCVRFGEEIANLRELGATGRGEDMEIGTYVKHFLKSELSGNVIDICPVGALTAKPWRYAARGWELKEHPSIAAHDCVGSNIYFHSRGRALVPQRVVMRCVPRENEAINETWISDRDRFSVTAINHNDRIQQPKQKINGRWHEVTWQEVLPELAKRLRTQIEKHGANQLGVLASPNSSCEELFLLQKIFRELGCNNIDHRYRQHDFSDDAKLPAYLNLGMTLSEVETRDAILLVGSNVRFSQPLLAHRINKATQDAARVFTINPVDYPFTFPVEEKIITADLVYEFAGVLRAVADAKQQSLAALQSVTISETAQRVAQHLLQAQQPAIILGLLANDHPQASKLRSIAGQLAKLLNAKIGLLSHGANSAGAAIVGMLPHRGPYATSLDTVGLNAKQQLVDQPLATYFLHNVELEYDCAYAETALTHLDQAELVICMNVFASEKMYDYADFILPIAPHSEYQGSFVNTCGQWQSFAAVGPAHYQSKPAWKVLRVLANLLDLPGYEYLNPQHILHDIKACATDLDCAVNFAAVDTVNAQQGDFRLAPWPMYRVDGLVRRAAALQSVAHEEQLDVIRINAKTASQHGLTQGQIVAATQGQLSVTLPVVVDEAIADHVIYLPSGLEDTRGFGESFAMIKLEGQA